MSSHWYLQFQLNTLEFFLLFPFFILLILLSMVRNLVSIILNIFTYLFNPTVCHQWLEHPSYLFDPQPHCCLHGLVSAFLVPQIPPSHHCLLGPLTLQLHPWSCCLSAPPFLRPSMLLLQGSGEERKGKQLDMKRECFLFKLRSQAQT